MGNGLFNVKVLSPFYPSFGVIPKTWNGWARALFGAGCVASRQIVRSLLPARSRPTSATTQTATTGKMIQFSMSQPWWL